MSLQSVLLLDSPVESPRSLLLMVLHVRMFNSFAFRAVKF